MPHVAGMKAVAPAQAGCGRARWLPASRRHLSSHTQLGRKRLVYLRVATGARDAGAAEEDELAASLHLSADDYQEDYGIEDCIDFYPQEQGTRARLCHPNGSTAEIDLLGARVTSWKTSDGREMLHTSNSSDIYGGIHKRDGVTLAFPQFGYGQLPRDGFVYKMPWEVVGTDYGDEEEVPDPAPGICMRLTDTEESRAMWPHSFQIDYQVNLMENDDMPEAQWFEEEEPVDLPAVDDTEISGKGQKAPRRSKAGKPAQKAEDDEDDGPEAHVPGEQQLRFMLRITNTGDTPMRFTAGLRPLLAVKNLALYGRWVRVLGLGAKYYFDYSTTPTPKLRMSGEDFLTFGDHEVDSVHVDVLRNHDVFFCPGDRSYMSIHNREGFKDIAVWNPHEGMPQEYEDFVSLGSARVARLVTLMPGEEWYAESVYRAHDQYWDEMDEFARNPQILAGLDHPPAEASRFDEEALQMDETGDEDDEMEI